MPKALAKTGSTQLSIKVPKVWLPEIDALAEKMSCRGLLVNRASLLRLLIRRGLDTEPRR
jgi:hypothetical protein